MFQAKPCAHPRRISGVRALDGYVSDDGFRHIERKNSIVRSRLEYDVLPRLGRQFVCDCLADPPDDIVGQRLADKGLPDLAQFIGANGQGRGVRFVAKKNAMEDKIAMGRVRNKQALVADPGTSIPHGLRRTVVHRWQGHCARRRGRPSAGDNEDCQCWKSQPGLYAKRHYTPPKGRCRVKFFLKISKVI
ncbi:MAG: hypothetical protein JF615_05020 [Asticcacaulis sp.]|nr:hypothetical protein [Asticcacaulis sp.]